MCYGYDTSSKHSYVFMVIMTTFINLVKSTSLPNSLLVVSHPYSFLSATFLRGLNSLPEGDQIGRTSKNPVPQDILLGDNLHAE